MGTLSESWSQPNGTAARNAFRLAWGFFAIASGIGVLLRIHPLHPIPGLNYAFVLHAHSHTAFLGWVYNAFFALALQCFLAPSERGGFRTLFFVTQAATLGMLLTFPFQGYARESIAFSSLHVGCSAVFAWKLLRRGQVVGPARTALRWAFGFLFLSTLGPILLGPLAAADLRDSPWYTMAIYLYLHFQYNGWFLFFLKALLLHRRTESTDATARRATRAVHWLGVGCVLTLALSALWMAPPSWVYVVGIVGATMQVIGCLSLVRWWRTAGVRFDGRVASWLMAIAAGGFFLKHGLQFAAGWPLFAELATQRMVVVGFLHLVFLATVTPMAMAWAAELGWMRFQGVAIAGLVLLSAGALVTEIALFAPAAKAMLPWLPLWPRIYESLAGAGLSMFLGIVLLLTAFARQGEPSPVISGRRP